MWKLIHIEICTKDFAGDMEEREKKAEKFSDWRKDFENILAEKKRFSHLPKTFSHEKKLFEKILHKIKKFSHNFRHNFGKNLAEKILHPNQFSQSRCEHNFISEGGGYTHLKLSLSSLMGY